MEKQRRLVLTLRFTCRANSSIDGLASFLLVQNASVKNTIN